MATKLIVDDDASYLRWLNEHPRGFVVNAGRTPNASYLVMHSSTCHTISGTPARGRRWTGDYSKIVADTRPELVSWCEANVGAEPTLCGTCQP